MCPNLGQALGLGRCVDIIFPEPLSHSPIVRHIREYLLAVHLGSPVTQLLVDPHSNVAFPLIDQKVFSGAGEMVSWLKAHTALTEDWTLALSNYIRWLKTPV